MGQGRILHDNIGLTVCQRGWSATISSTARPHATRNRSQRRVHHGAPVARARSVTELAIAAGIGAVRREPPAAEVRG